MGYKLASNTWDSKEIEAIHAVIKSDMYSMGKKVEKYEKDFAKYIGSDFAIMTSSGSTANLLMIAAMFFTKDESRKLRRGDEVIVPVVSWSTTYFPLLVPECFLIEPTETETKAELDAFVDAMIAVKREAETDAEFVKQAPYTTAVRRLDDVKAARELDLVWKADS
mgnify:CR=1 FL=1